MGQEMRKIVAILALGVVALVLLMIVIDLNWPMFIYDYQTLLTGSFVLGAAVIAWISVHWQSSHQRQNEIRDAAGLMHGHLFSSYRLNSNTKECVEIKVPIPKSVFDLTYFSAAVQECGCLGGDMMSALLDLRGRNSLTPVLLESHHQMGREIWSYITALSDKWKGVEGAEDLDEYKLEVGIIERKKSDLAAARELLLERLTEFMEVEYMLINHLKGIAKSGKVAPFSKDQIAVMTGAPEEEAPDAKEEVKDKSVAEGVADAPGQE